MNFRIFLFILKSGGKKTFGKLIPTVYYERQFNSPAKYAKFNFFSYFSRISRTKSPECNWRSELIYNKSQFVNSG